MLYSEIDEEGWERRKVDEYADGRLDFADDVHEMGSTRLGDQVVPAVLAIDADPEFSAVEIPAADFEAVWWKATTQPGPFCLTITSTAAGQFPALDAVGVGEIKWHLLELQPARRIAVEADEIRVDDSASAQVAPAIVALVSQRTGARIQIAISRTE